MYRSVLTDRSFVAWAQDRIVPLVTHDGLEHEEREEKDSYGKDVKRCSLYPGISCSEHVGASVDVDNARGEGLVKLPMIELCPNTWLVTPAGKVVRVAEEDQFEASRERKAIEAVLAEVGKPLSEKVVRAIDPLLARAEKAVDEESWRPALTDLAAVEAAANPLPEGLRAWIQTLLDAVEEDAVYAFEHVRDDAKLPADEKRKKIEEMRASLDVSVLGKRVPTFAAIEAYLAK